MVDVSERADYWAARNSSSSVYFNDNLLFKVLKLVDVRTLVMAACVSKQWHKTMLDERLWELIYTKRWVNTGCGEQWSLPPVTSIVTTFSTSGLSPSPRENARHVAGLQAQEGEEDEEKKKRKKLIGDNC
ncbi:uncharacterized protein LOC129284923 [Prosopis cineraria]|uniref:uncharacterized protein LOC129284923 n=1 Tax=Prosopis cineraria TaxID=364024 RepID=UPI0024106E1E|nr:uncharacterized protein LOC129284923 [Prosopis cineraria]